MLHNDDTGARILHFLRDTADKRAGLHTSAIVSQCADHRIALFFTGRRHAGENLADVLKLRPAGAPPPIQMCDALGHNTSKDWQVLLAHCIAHGRRRFVDQAASFPGECGFVLETLRQVFHNDHLARERGINPDERLLFHQQHSGPLMETLNQWCGQQFAEHSVEPNSGLGKAISYLLNHWEPLTLFLRVAGAPLDNNLAERALKKAILNRKNAYFYKTRNGRAWATCS